METLYVVGEHMRKFIRTNGYDPANDFVPDEAVLSAAEYAKTKVPGEKAASIADYCAFDTINCNAGGRATREYMREAAQEMEI